MVPNHARYHLRYTPLYAACSATYTSIIKSRVFVKDLTLIDEIYLFSLFFTMSIISLMSETTYLQAEKSVLCAALSVPL